MDADSESQLYDHVDFLATSTVPTREQQNTEPNSRTNNRRKKKNNKLKVNKQFPNFEFLNSHNF